MDRLEADFEVRPEVVYVSTLTIPLWALLARMRRIPVLSHIHEAEASASTPIKKVLVTRLLMSNANLATSEFSRL